MVPVERKLGCAVGSSLIICSMSGFKKPLVFAVWLPSRLYIFWGSGSGLWTTIVLLLGCARSF